MPDSPLEFYQTRELMDEVRRRFDDAIFVGYQAKTNTISDYVVFIHGSQHGVIGLATMAAQAAEKTVNDDTPD